jgi:hypothetical protein
MLSTNVRTQWESRSVRISLIQFVTDLTPRPQDVAAWAEERGFTGLHVPEKTHVPVSRQIPWPGGELGWRRW